MILAVSGDNFENSIPEESKAFYEETKHKWFESETTVKVPGKRVKCVEKSKKNN